MNEVPSATTMHTAIPSRPLGVIVLAVVLWFFALLFFVAGVGLAVATLAGRPGGGLALGYSSDLLAAIASAAFVAGVSYLLGWGIWALRNWARALLLIVATIQLAILMLRLLGSGTTGVTNEIEGALMMGMLSFAAWVIYYLRRPHIRLLFCRTADDMLFEPTFI